MASLHAPSARDLRTLLAVVAAGRADEPGIGLPPALLEGLAQLVPCDAVSFLEHDVGHQQVLIDQDFPTDPPPSASSYAAFWAHFWDSPACSYAERTGDLVSVLKLSDFQTRRQLHHSGMYADVMRPLGFEHELIVSLPTAAPGHNRRIVFFRGPRRDFTDRDRLALALLRPHLYAAWQDAERRRRSTPKLTPREWEVLRLLATGRRNDEIARLLVVSAATVRKHLEHVYDKLGVGTRTAAVALAFPDGLSGDGSSAPARPYRSSDRAQ